MATRTLRLFAMHARVGDALADYTSFFEWLGSLDASSTRLSVYPDLVFVLERVSPLEGQIVLEFISGDPTEINLSYNDSTGEVEVGSQDEGTWPARQTRVIVNPTKRLLVLEIRRAGVSARNLEKYFRVLARERGFADNFQFDLGPVQGESFETELNKFSRIREATIVISRPNTDWDDVYEPVSMLAETSNGQTAKTTITAPRNESLSKEHGIVEIIRNHARRALTSVKRAAVRGEKLGEPGETTLSTEKHQLKKTVDLPREGSESDAVIVTGIELIEEQPPESIEPETPELED